MNLFSLICLIKLILHVNTVTLKVGPSQPLTTPIWTSPERLPYSAFMQLQIALSDIVSFHHYGNADGLVNVIDNIRTFEATRPIVCTEFMARTAGYGYTTNIVIIIMVFMIIVYFLFSLISA